MVSRALYATFFARHFDSELIFGEENIRIFELIDVFEMRFYSALSFLKSRNVLIEF